MPQREGLPSDALQVPLTTTRFLSVKILWLRAPMLPERVDEVWHAKNPGDQWHKICPRVGR